MAPGDAIRLMQAVTTADPSWTCLLGSLAAGSPEAAQLLQQSLSAADSQLLWNRAPGSSPVMAATANIHVLLLQGEDWVRNIGLPTIDLASYHFYPNNGARCVGWRL